MPTYSENEYGYLVSENENGSVTFIRMDDDNPEYQRYLNPEAEHFTPNLAD